VEEHGYTFAGNYNIYMRLAPLNCQLQQLKYLAMHLYFDLPVWCFGKLYTIIYKDHLSEVFAWFST